MKKILLLSAAFVLISSCEDVMTPSIMEIESRVAQTDVPITLQRAEIESNIELEDIESLISAELNGSIIPLQYDDWDGDGIWDEVFGLMNLQQGTNQLSITPASKKEAPEVATRTNLHLGKVIIQDSVYKKVNSGNRVSGTKTATTIARYQFEGPGWENDLVAFRTYFDERNGIDIFGKRTPDMVLHAVGINDDYHTLADWGMDILKVGNSLGAGAIAFSYQDSLYRVTDDTTSTVQFLIEGPLRSSLEYYFPSVTVGDTMVEVTHRITIIAGMNGYQSEVSVSPVLPGLELATGVVNLETEDFYSINYEEYSGIYTHGSQAYEGEYLGMAVLTNTAPKSGDFTTIEEGEGITQTFGVTIQLDDNGSANFIFLTGWERQNEAYRDIGAFEDMLKKTVLKLSR